MGRVLVCAPAKINLFLHVGDLRDDGFHDLESLVVFAEICDRLKFEPAEQLTLQLEGPFASNLGACEGNLVLKAAQALGDGRGAAITLEKNLPIAAGLGGGSADAGATLRGLNRFWNLEHSEGDLVAIATGLGSDVPACVLSRPCWMEGRGEKLAESAAIPSVMLVLVNPNISVATKTVFASLNARSGLGRKAPPLSDIRTIWDLVDYLADTNNDLEAAATSLVPAIEDVLAALAHEPGSVLAQMSGSGATCFGLFQDGPWASGAAARMAADHPDWWVCAGRIAPPGFGTPIDE